MIDRVISLLNSGHRGKILAVSRRGLLPRTHEPTSALSVGLANIPLAAPMSVLTGWLRRLARHAEERRGNWRDAVDGVRPHIKAVYPEHSIVRVRSNS